MLVTNYVPVHFRSKFTTPTHIVSQDWDVLSFSFKSFLKDFIPHKMIMEERFWGKGFWGGDDRLRKSRGGGVTVSYYVTLNAKLPKPRFSVSKKRNPRIEIDPLLITLSRTLQRCGGVGLKI